MKTLSFDLLGIHKDKWLSLILCVFLAACQECDPPREYGVEDIRLPAYSERGNNIAGALNGDRVWNTRDICNIWRWDIFQCTKNMKIYAYPDRTLIAITGVWSQPNDDMDYAIMCFELMDVHLNSYEDLEQLSTMNLSQSASSKIRIGVYPFLLNISETWQEEMDPNHPLYNPYPFPMYYKLDSIQTAETGNFHLRKIEAQYSNRGGVEELSHFIISGTFGFDLLNDENQDLSHHYGRFDYKFYGYSFEKVDSLSAYIHTNF